MTMKKFNWVNSIFMLCLLCLCGTQGNAQTFTFTSAAAVGIPDAAYDGTEGSMASKTLAVAGIPGVGTIASIKLSANIGHTWPGDMTFKLKAPGGQILALVSRMGLIEAVDDGSECCGTSNDMLIANTYTFDDGASTASEDWGALGSPIPTSSVTPSNGSILAPPAFTSFADLATAVGIGGLNGNWTLLMGDGGAGDVGNVSNVSFEIIITADNGGGEGEPDVCALTCPGTQYIHLDPGACLYTYTYPVSISSLCVVTPDPILNFTGQFSTASSLRFPDGVTSTQPYTGVFTGNTVYTVQSGDGFNGDNASLSYYNAVYWNVAVAGNVKFNWTYATNDGPLWDQTGYLKNMPATFTWFGNQTGAGFGVYQLSSNAGAFNQAGLGNVNVTAGGKFGFYAFTQDGGGGAATMVITNFSYASAPVLPVITQTSGVNIGYVADFSGGLVDIITEEFPIGTTTVTYSGVGPDGPISCSFDVVVAGITNPIASLACNDDINISVDTNCVAVINADQILEGGPYGCYDDYIVAIGTNMQGPFNLGNTVTCANIGQTLAVQVTDPNTGNRCWGWIHVEDKIPPTIDCDGCVAEVNELFGTLDFTDPLAGNFTQSCYDFGLGTPTGGNHPYDLVNFSVPVTGSYTFALVSQGPFIGGQGYCTIYGGAGFVPGSPCTNLIGGMDEFIMTDFTVNLVAGQNYQMLIIDYGQLSGNIFDWTVTVNGPGGVGILAAVPCEIGCSDIAALLAATTIEDLTDLGIESSVPDAFDNCEGPACGPLTYSFTVGALSNTDMCAEGRFIPVTWTVTDLGGNSVSCTENVGIDLPTLDEVVFPDQVTVACGSPTDPDAFNSQAPDNTPFNPAYNPNALDGNTIDEDWPAVDGNDIRNQGTYCNLVSQYHDDEILLCGPNSGAKKIIRRWTVVDWCTNEIRESVQLIKVEDVIAPAVNAGPDFTVNASPWSCSVYGLTLPAATVFEACSPNAITWRVLIGNVVLLNTNGGVVSNAFELGVGQHTLVYEATDACGNVGTDQVILTVVDNTPPNIICKEFLQVTTNPNGCLNLIPADRFDNGSYDNCCSDDELVFKVRRMSEPNDSYFRDTIAVGVFSGRVMYNNGLPLFGNVNNSREVPRDDLSGTVTGPYGEKFCGKVDVLMRVYCAGSPQYFADCMVQVFVDDKTRPVISAPANVIVHCEDNPSDNVPPHLQYDQYFGYATWTDPCGSVTFDSTVTGTLNDCGEGVLVKTWRATDKCGNQDVKSQTVTVRHISDFEVIFPADTMITACVDTLDFTPVPHDPIWWPRFDRNDCEQLATTWWDERFYGENDACFKIVRHWKVINWCAFNVDQGNTYDDVILNSWRLPITCKWRPSSINQFTANDCNLWRDIDVYRRMRDGGNYSNSNPNLWTKGDGVIEYIQVIKVKDNEDPIIQVINPKPCPQFGTPVEEDTYSNIPSNTPNTPWVYNVVGVLYNGVCSAPAGTLKASAIDCSNKLNYHYEVDGFASTTNLNLKSIDFAGLTPVITDILPMGLHRVYWSVNDACGNTSYGNYWVRLRDCKKPSPVCFNGLATVVMPSAGMITLPATYFNHNSFDNCTPADGLIYSYSADVNETSRTWTCDDIIANGSPIFEITMYVTDGDGNQDFCNTFIRIDDNDGVCDTVGTLISGTVKTFAPSEGIKDVVVTLSNSVIDITADATGEYNAHTTMTGIQKLEGKHDKDYLNGVNVGDIIKIQNHLLNKNLLDQPYKMMAADVNIDGKVSNLDILAIRSLILGKTDKFAAGKSWRTYDALYSLNMNNWAQAPDFVTVDINSSVTNADLKGVKLGDVDLNAKANFGSGAIEQRTVGTLSFRADDVQMTAGQTIEIPVKAKDFKNIAGYQFTFAFDNAAMEFVDMKSGELAISAENFSALKASEGIVTTIFASEEAATIADDAVLFTLVFNAKSEVALSKVLTANSSLTPAMGVNSSDENLDIALEFNTNNGVVASGDFDLKQNNPNPFSTVTAIEFNLPQASKATLTIYDVTGKIVYTRKVDAAKGLNKELVSRTQIGSTGVMFYQLVAGDYSATKKMVILD